MGVDVGKGGGLVLVLLAPRGGGILPRAEQDQDEDKHKAPASTQPLPLSLQDAEALLFPDALVIVTMSPGPDLRTGRSP